MSPPATTGAAIDGRWEFETTVVSAIGTAIVPFASVIFSGVLHNNNGVVDGLGQAFFVEPNATTTACLQPAIVTVHGSFDGTRHLTLTSAQVTGTVFTLDLDVPLSLGATMSGTASATGTCPVPAGTMASIYSTPITGTYSGTMTGETHTGTPPVTTPDSVVPTATMTVSESDPDPATGKSVITGNATLTFPTCSVTLPVNTSRYGARNSSVQIYPAMPPVVFVGSVPGNRANLGVVYLDDTCKTQPANTPLTFTQWVGAFSPK